MLFKISRSLSIPQAPFDLFFQLPDPLLLRRGDMGFALHPSAAPLCMAILQQMGQLIAVFGMDGQRQAGDVWTLGRHRLVCGDSTKAETFARLMDGLKANLVITDPPYNVNYEGSAGKIKNDNMENAAFYDFRIQRKPWRMMPPSMCSTRTPRG